MVRRIGRGSYGEVWLAKSVTGAYRAVKIVRRSNFDHERPYEREFAGLLKFEPISRSSESQIDVLHVGRDDTEGYFFYVMELADDQKRGQNIDPADYAPRTLRSELYSRERLPATECVEIGLRLAGALKHLHAHGLVHRDLKPSNIVFVNGIPKLADIGLVTGAGDAKSALGTEGYVPQEGMGTPQADLYALGKVLYEASTGRDRLDYPELPTDLRDFPDRGQLVGMNDVILRACSEDRSQRFQSAAEMVEALLCLREGRVPPIPARGTKIKGRRWALGVGALAALACCIWLATIPLRRGTQTGLHYVRSVEMPGVLDWSNGMPGDFNGDGEKEIFLVRSNQLFVISSDGEELRRSERLEEPGDDLNVSALEDMDQDGKDEVFISWRERTNLYSGVLNQNLQAIKKFQLTGAMLSPQAGQSLPDSRLTGFTVSGTPPKLFGCILTGYALNPRGVVCLDFKTGKLLWQYFTASSANHLLTLDLDEDGSQDVVAGSYSVANGNKLSDGTDDLHSYLYALSGSGKLLWKLEMGDAYTECVPFRETQHPQTPASSKAAALFTDQREISPRRGFFVAVRRNVDGKCGEVWKVDPQGNRLRHYDAKAPLLSWTVTSNREGREKEVLLTDCAGSLHVLDTNLQIKRVVPLLHKRYDYAALTLDAVSDLDKNGTSELVLHSSQVRFLDPETKVNRRSRNTDCRLWVLDQNLQVLAQFPIPEPRTISTPITVAISDGKDDRGTEIIVLAEQATVLQWRR